MAEPMEPMHTKIGIFILLVATTPFWIGPALVLLILWGLYKLTFS
jgi:hypothetical protein